MSETLARDAADDAATDERAGEREAEAARAAEVGQISAVWAALMVAAEELARREPVLASLAHLVVLDHRRFEDALAFRAAQKLGGPELSPLFLRDLFGEALAGDPAVGAAAAADILAVYDRDPSCTNLLEPLLFFKGYLAVEASRVAHYYWGRGRREIARLLQMRVSEATGVDIHPGAVIGRGLMIDHATGVVIGETAVVGDDVSMLHGVTLGGTGKETGDRHPKIGRNVLIGAGASILGNIRVGDCSRVGAGSVVLSDVPRNTTVAGVPARVVGEGGCPEPSKMMDHRL